MINHPITGRKIRFALVGCGRISVNHIDSILDKHRDNAELVAVCDIESSALRAAEKKTGVPGFTDIKEMLKLKNIDAVILATPSGLHAGQAILAAQSGRHGRFEVPYTGGWVDNAKRL